MGFKLGAFLKSSGRVKTLLLYGALGTGKTTMIKGIASAFGIAKRELGSASFVMVAEYETMPPFYHIDLYRLEGPGDIDAAGIWEYIGTGGVAVIEWAERLSQVPDDALSVSIIHPAQESDQVREIIVEGIDEADWHHLQDRQT